MADTKIETVYKGRVVTLNLETVTLPNGISVELEVVRHPGAAAIVPLKDDHTVILIRQYRLAAGGYIYEIPAGKLHPGENPAHCATRELEEEIGYRAGHLDKIATFFTAPGFTDEVMHLYVARDLARGTQALDSDEVLEIVEMPLEKAMAHIEDGTIRDAKTIIGLQSIFLHRNRDRHR
ncbi:MAG TPA: NUDIX hydrolase [Nitrospiraceae bacterium]|jgi:ADP-ribose pyrophosphatase|nr:NUDIX hydrolase [Nitrospiraceae bacterium]